MNNPNNEENKLGGGSNQQVPMDAAQPRNAVCKKDEQQADRNIYARRLAVRRADIYLKNMLGELKKIDAVGTIKKKDGILDWNKFCNKISFSGSLLKEIHSDLKTKSKRVEDTSNSRQFAFCLGRMEKEIFSVMELVEGYEIVRKPKGIERVLERKQLVIRTIEISIEEVRELFKDVLASMNMEDTDDDDDDDDEKKDDEEKDGANQQDELPGPEDKKKGKTSKRNTEGNLENAFSAKRVRKDGGDKEHVGEPVQLAQDQAAFPPAQVGFGEEDDEPVDESVLPKGDQKDLLETPLSDVSGNQKKMEDCGSSPIPPPEEPAVGEQPEIVPQNEQSSITFSLGEGAGQIASEVPVDTLFIPKKQLEIPLTPENPSVPKLLPVVSTEGSTQSEMSHRVNSEVVYEEPVFPSRPTTPDLTGSSGQFETILQNTQTLSQIVNGESVVQDIPKVPAPQADSPPLHETPLESPSTSGNPALPAEEDIVEEQVVGLDPMEEDAQESENDDADVPMDSQVTANMSRKRKWNAKSGGTAKKQDAPKIGTNVKNVLRLEKAPAKRDRKQLSREAGFEEDNMNYYTLTLALGVAEMEGIEVTEEQKKRLHELADVKMINYENEEIPATVDDEDLSEEENYRGLKVYFEDNVHAQQKLNENEPKSKTHEFAFHLTSAVYGNPEAMTGKEVSEELDRGKAKGRNFLCKYKTKVELPKMPLPTDQNALFIPTKIFNGLDIKKKNFLTKLIENPLSAIRNLETSTTFDKKLFDIEILIGQNAEATIPIISQLPQSPEENKNSDLENSESKPWQSHKGFSHIMKVSEFIVQKKKIIDIVKKHLKKLLSKDVKKQRFDALKKDIEVNTGRRLLFGTNFEFQGQDPNVKPESDPSAPFHKQHLEIEKLPEWMKPRGLENLMRLITRSIGGISSPQMYFKWPGSRTIAHIENSALGSINWNFGPGKCLWFNVSLEYAGQLEELIYKKSGERLYGAYWPSAKDIRDAGIPLQVFLQKPGDMVFVSYASIHWVQSLGFADNLSWNVGLETKTQLDVIALFFDHQTFAWGMPTIPVQELFWQIGIEKKYTDNPQMFKTMKNILFKLLAHVKNERESVKLKDGETIEKKVDGWDKDIRCKNKNCQDAVFNIFCERTSKGTKFGDQKYVNCVKHYQGTYRDAYYFRQETEFYEQVYSDYVYTGPEQNNRVDDQPDDQE